MAEPQEEVKHDNNATLRDFLMLFILTPIMDSFQSICHWFAHLPFRFGQKPPPHVVTGKDFLNLEIIEITGDVKKILRQVYGVTKKPSPFSISYGKSLDKLVQDKKNEITDDENLRNNSIVVYYSKQLFTFTAQKKLSNQVACKTLGKIDCFIENLNSGKYYVIKIRFKNESPRRSYLAIHDADKNAGLDSIIGILPIPTSGSSKKKIGDLPLSQKFQRYANDSFRENQKKNTFRIC